MAPIPGRWHDDSGVLDLNSPAPAMQAALAFAVYGLRLRADGIFPGPVEATITIADRAGHLMGRLDLDARDARWMVDAISDKLEIDYGRGGPSPWTGCWPTMPSQARATRMEADNVNPDAARDPAPAGEVEPGLGEEPLRAGQAATASVVAGLDQRGLLAEVVLGEVGQPPLEVRPGRLRPG